MIDLNKLEYEIKYYVKDNFTIATCDELLMFGSCEGNNYLKAIEDLQSTIDEYYNVLKDDKENLGALPKTDLDYLNEIFGIENKKG